MMARCKCVHEIQHFWVSDFVMKEAAWISETLINLWQATRRYSTADSHCTRRREDLKWCMLLDIA